MSNTSIAALFGSYQLVSFIVSEISAFMRTDRQADRRTWLDRLYFRHTLWGRKRLLYFMGSETIPFTCYTFILEYMYIYKRDSF